MLSKICRETVQQDAALTQRLSDLLFDIGKSLMVAKEYEGAFKWLEKALDAFSQGQSDEPFADAAELKLCILHGLGTVQTYLKDVLAAQ